ncbi:receptor-like protein 9DC1 [Lycium barbarum]|uniref:receptor-like protein 9DC1 n=1 Tax=Lycium barbarum TaxID=112863 RepID=UPI00293F4B72|nr:receptor-like protein 9DC1 [Lycium barbarum]
MWFAWSHAIWHRVPCFARTMVRGMTLLQQLESLTSLALLNLSYNHLVGCIPKGKQFDTFENCSYQGNDGLHGFPLSKDCDGDDGVPQVTTPVELDQGEEGDSAMISWQAFLIGYCCGLIVVLSVIYIMLATQNPAWFSRMFDEWEHRIVTRIAKAQEKKIVCNLKDSCILSCWDAIKALLSELMMFLKC